MNPGQTSGFLWSDDWKFRMNRAGGLPTLLQVKNSTVKHLNECGHPRWAFRAPLNIHFSNKFQKAQMKSKGLFTKPR